MLSRVVVVLCRVVTRVASCCTRVVLVLCRVASCWLVLARVVARVVF